MSQVRALLLTDVVDSTGLSERLGDQAMAAVWAAHDRAARDLLPQWRGREIDKTDGMLLLFEAAADALRYALAYHRALAGLPVALQARAGLHVGPVILRENSAEDVARGAKPIEVEGLAKPMAARIMSLARGGQTLLTPEARRALADFELPLTSHGHWVLKGVSTPVELFEAAEDASGFAAPADGDKVYRVVQVGGRWLPTRQIPNNLPQQTTSFIGRERELDAIRELLAHTRLVTLSGMGGLGKTRLALQVAAELMAEYPDGAWFMDLAPIRDPALVTGEVAYVLGVREEAGRPLLQTLCAHLAARRALLVFDNCEHLIGPAAEIVQAVLRAAPGVRVVATSRETLRIAGEQVCPVLPLPVPGQGDSLETLARSTAVRLFVERAEAQQPSFALTARDAPAVAELVARLEGIPLALELAAARVRSLAVADINRRLADRYQILTGGPRLGQARQQTLRALVDWSYELLQPDEQRVFNRLAAFAGSFDLEAAEQVCGLPPLDPGDVIDTLASLVDKSLVMRDESTRSTRYRLLVTLRDYAQARLSASGEEAAVAAAHCSHYFAVAKQVRSGLHGPEQGKWIDHAESDMDNLRAAMRSALTGGDAIVGVKLIGALLRFWLLRGYATEGRSIVRDALALPEIQGSDTFHARALYVGATLASSQSDHGEALRMLETCLLLQRQLGNPVEIAATLSTLSTVRLQRGDVAAAIEGEREALAIFEQLGDRQGMAVGHLSLAQFAAHEGDDAEARAQLEAGIAMARAIGRHDFEAECLLLSAMLACDAGDVARARLAVADAVRICRQAGNREGEATGSWWHGRLDLEAGDPAAAWPQLAGALQSFHRFEMNEPLLGCLEDMARAALDTGAGPLAAALCACVQRSRQRLALARSPRDDRRWRALEKRLGEEVAALPSSLDAWTVDEAVRVALAGAAGLGRAGP